MSYSSPLFKNRYEQWVHSYLTVMSEPTYKLQQGYNWLAAQEAWKRDLYPLIKSDNRTMSQEGWLSFVKGIQSMYEIKDFRAACSKAKQVIASRHTRKDIMDLWTTPCQTEQSTEELKKALETAKYEESRIHQKKWVADRMELDAIDDYNSMKIRLERQERIKT